MRWDIVLERCSRNRLNENIVRRHLESVAESAQVNRSLGFRCKVGKFREPELITDPDTKEEVWRYRVKFRLIRDESRDDDQECFEHILQVVSKNAASKGWQPLEDRVEAVASDDEQETGNRRLPKTKFVVPKLTEAVLRQHFRGVYERDAHIRTIHSSVETAVATDGEILSHILLYGLPGGCKTILMERFKKWYEEGSQTDTRVAFIDGTTMTKAGLERWLIELALDNRLPDVLVADELEKQPLDNLLSLNNVMGSGVLTRLNAHTGNLRLPCRVLVVGICNDEQSLKGFRNGSLWSRFSNKLPCVRPSRQLCERILTEMVQSIPGGKASWAKRALDFGWEKLGERDIRELKRHLSGGERLLSNEWQADQLQILAAKKTEDCELLKDAADAKTAAA